MQDCRPPGGGTIAPTMFYRGGLMPLAYVVVGAFVAGTHHYFAHVNSVRTISSALLAIFLWPLVLLGISLHIR
jgi:hypothetical protein